MKFYFSFVCFVVIAFFSDRALQGESSRANVVVIMTDDQGWGDLGMHGNEVVETPHLDRLAREGLRFKHFFTQPVCSPTRAEFLTGRYHPRSGVFHTGGGGERMDTDEETIAEVFREAGYGTGVFGKWHNGTQYPYHPMGRGFDEFYGFTSGHWGLYFNPMIEDNGAMTRAKGYLPDDYTDKAMEFINGKVEEDRPFFVFLAYNIPHSPMQVPDRFWAKYEDLEIPQSGTDAENEVALHTKAALAMCENIDWNVGRLMAELDKLGVDQETIVVFLSDNGPNGHRWNAGMRGIKGSTDEGGVRTPLLMRWPTTVESGKVITQIGGAIDLLPTLTDLAGISHEPKMPLDGVSLKPLILGDSVQWEDRKLVAFWKGEISVRTQRFRLDNAGRLYDMESDPRQQQDVSLQHADIVRELGAYAEAWRRDMVSEGADVANARKRATRPFLVGHTDFNISYLPARDAEASGTIQRSNRWPNDSYFTHWTEESDRIAWNVEVLEAGLYAAEIWYACAEKNIGPTIELSCGNAATSVVVRDPHDPPQLGDKYSRAPLYESPVKIFRRLGLGSLRLEAGRNTMILRALEIPGDEAIEFRLMSLTRIL